MSMNVNQDYSQFYVGTEQLKSYGSNSVFQKEITQVDKSLNLPSYSGMYGADKAVASAVENCGKEEQGVVYDIIRQNFLVGNSGSMTEEERQANISLGMKKAE